MTITWQDGHFVIKTKNTVVRLGDKPAVGEREIANPGEYDIQGVFVEAIPLKETPPYALVVHTEGMRLLWVPTVVGTLSESSEQTLDGIDVVLMGVGKGAIDVEHAVQLVRALEPKGVTIKQFPGADVFVQKEGLQPQSGTSAKLTLATLPLEGRILFVLE